MEQVSLSFLIRSMMNVCQTTIGYFTQLVVHFLNVYFARNYFR